jgi:STE24 endopeptidase
MIGKTAVLLNALAVLLLCLSSGAQGSPAPSSGQNAVAATQPIVYSLPPDKLEKSEALYKLDMKMSIFGTLYSWLVLLIILYAGIGAKFRDWAESVSRWRFVQAWIFVPLLLILLALADLPLSMYGHHISLQYGLSVQNWGSWFADQGKAEILEIVILAVLLWLMLLIIRKSPRRWWFYFWLILMPVIVFVVYITPSVIDPLFNKFEPLETKNPQLVAAIEKVAERAGENIPPDRIFEMKASEKVTTLNAYVTGFGASKRIVIWDTTIQNTTLPEILFVVGHEMGHYVLLHIPKGLAGTAIGLLVGLYILFHLLGWSVRRFGQRWRILALHDWAALPMIFLLAGIMGFLAEPLGNAFSRHFEHQADIYGLEVTHGINANSRQVAAQSFQVLGELSLAYPHPSKLAVFWYWSHPTIADRVRFAQEYDPWDKGESPKYVK